MVATISGPDTRSARVQQWKAIVERFQKPHLGRALWQVTNTFVPYVAIWCALAWVKDVSWWLAPPLVLLGAGFMVRVFIIFHDCGHGSFFRSERANAVLGFVAGMMTFTPYYHWRGEHALHHRTTGDLDRRGVGDVWTMTVQEYLEASRWKKFAYVLARNPVVLFVLAPSFLFLVLQRFPSRGASGRERRSVWWMDLALVGLAAAMSQVFGLVPYLVLHASMMSVAGVAGVWLFYVQHQFEDAYWERGGDWDYTEAAMKGSSFYRLPRVMQWFSGNIGFHHVHHLSPRIPNYNLEACHRSDPMFHEVTPITLRASLRSLGLRLWDESSRKLVGWRHMRELRRQHRDAARAEVRESAPHDAGDAERRDAEPQASTHGERAHAGASHEVGASPGERRGPRA
ncbi:MAG: fatty acid desaturase [Planctomycetes bacterium]|nr:fatty acid desaturase [Planctomycetota bacterium]